MKPAENIFVIPTYRLRDVGATVEAYDEHFWSNGHAVKMMVFDDSSLANHEKYFSQQCIDIFELPSLAPDSPDKQHGMIFGKANGGRSNVRSTKFSATLICGAQALRNGSSGRM